jgi:alanine racemase
MPRPIEAVVHSAALSHNLDQIRNRSGDARIWAVIKADAYGHGVEQAYPGLIGADGFALLDLQEAERLRQLGWRGPILLLEGCFEARDLELCSRLGLWHVVHCDEQIDWLSAHKTHQPHQVMLKMNSGMNRLGFRPEAFRTAWARLCALPQVDEIGLITHFADADGPPSDSRIGDTFSHQIGVFAHTTQDLPGSRSLANSAAILRHADQRLQPGRPAPTVAADWVRAGVALYGASPDFPQHSAADWRLRPAMSLRSRLVATQHLAAGDSVGYGSTFTAATPMTIGIVACGYADGYPRHAPGHAGSDTPILVEGVRTRLVGRVSMDMLAVDLEPVIRAGHHPGFGSEVTLWGCSSDGTLLPIDEVAAAAGTIGYELMCALSRRVPVRVEIVEEDTKVPVSRR